MFLVVRSCPPDSALALIFLVCIGLILLSMDLLGRRSDDEDVDTYTRRRTELYKTLAVDLGNHGATFSNIGITSQSLNVSDIFSVKDGSVQPVLKVADPAIRACVLYLDPQYADVISSKVKKIFSPYFRGGVWFQDPKMYHFSMFHASHHQSPVAATSLEIDTEARQIQSVAKRCCKLSIILDKVVMTSTGVLLGCWQVLNGTEPAVIRKELQQALPHAPTWQFYDEVMLHTSFARLLGPHNASGEDAEGNTETDPTSVIQRLVARLNKELYQFKADVRELWFVEELDVLALALNGRIRTRRFALGCM